MPEVVIEKLVHGGQGLATLADGKKALLWNVLPGEKVVFEPRRSKSSFVEGIATEIIEASAEREQPRDDLYLSTSPWQMMSYEAENTYKKSILTETLIRAKVDVSVDRFLFPDEAWHYRNKMEYSFWGDEDGLHLALFNRGTHRKQRLQGSSIARPEIDATAQAVRDVLATAQVRAGDVKSVIVRCNTKGETVAALFTRNEQLARLPFENVAKGVVVYYSNPKSPASVATRELYRIGDVTLQDDILGRTMTYDVLSFFQVNLQAYEQALMPIKDFVSGHSVTDMYSGTGSIGLSVTDGDVTLVELDPYSVAMARHNANGRGTVIESSSEKALDYIPAGQGKAVIFDPPRAGLHADVTQAVLDKKPERIAYLSCNPSTFARDLELLQNDYSIETIHGYNFFPRTPHIEALALLTVKG
jgi:23S rRNA (uracil1939-C5)-methyltransferase